MEWFLGGIIVYAVAMPLVMVGIAFEGVLERAEKAKQATRKHVKAVPTGRISKNRKVGAA